MTGKNARQKPEGEPSGPRDVHGVQGEGNREADRRYREAAKRFAESGRVEEAARDAAEAEDEPGAPRRSEDESEEPEGEDEELQEDEAPDDEDGSLH